MNMETERLIIRKFYENDWEDLFEYLSKKEVLKYEPELESNEEDCRKKAIERADSDNFFAVCLKENHKMIGHVYFSRVEPEEFLTWEIGYIFNPSYYGKGYATEACKKIIDYGFNELGAYRIFARCNPENKASWKLLERLLMRREGHFIKNAYFHKDKDGLPIWFDSFEYAVLADEWR